MIGRAVRGLDERFGQAKTIRKTLRYVFPEHWSFLLGEIALYSFVVLVGTGVYLTFFFEPSYADTVYRGDYVPLVGRQVTEAYASVVAISFDVKAGLLIRQTHHWAANVFIAAIILHLMRIFFTGAFRKPRDLTYYVGLTMLGLAIFEGFLGYSLIDDLLSGSGLAIAFAVVESVPIVGANIALLIFGGEYPGADSFMSRMYIFHVLIVPVAIAGLIAIHLLMVAMTHHSQFREPGKHRRNVVGTPLWPAYALRSIGLMLAVAAALFLLGGLVQINPIWLWGPYETWLATNGAQPDWYLGWLIGGMRLVPGFDVEIGSWIVVPNPFWAGALFPTLVFLFLYLYPTLERRSARDYERHHLLDRPRDAPHRTAIGISLMCIVAVVLFTGSADRVMVQTGLSYEAQIWAYRAMFFIVPALAYWLTLTICRELRDSGQHPVREERGAIPAEPQSTRQ